MFRVLVSAIAGGAFLFCANASAGVIISADSASASSTYNNSSTYHINETKNQSGLNRTYASGVTDFDTYIATSPKHSVRTSLRNTWHSGGSSDPTPVVDYDLGAVFTIDAIALWVEPIYGINEAEIWGSVDGSNYFLLSIVNPPDNQNGAIYEADVFSFAATALQYVRLQLDCTHNGSNICGIGEIAFRVADVSDVPIPAAFPLLLSGLAGLGFAARRRKAA